MDPLTTSGLPAAGALEAGEMVVVVVYLPTVMVTSAEVEVA
jgi:hypothetical protein